MISTVAAVLAATVPVSAAATRPHHPQRPQHRASNGSVLLTEPFTGTSVDDPGFVPLNAACLTGASSTLGTTTSGSAL